MTQVRGVMRTQVGLAGLVRERNSLTRRNPASAQEQVKYRKANQVWRLLQSHFDKNKQNFSSYVLLLFQAICYFRGPQAKLPIFPNQLELELGYSNAISYVLPNR